jgi:hypothetical protein
VKSVERHLSGRLSNGLTSNHADGFSGLDQRPQVLDVQHGLEVLLQYLAFGIALFVLQ